MTIAKEVVYALHQRLKELAVDATPDKIAYLAKALESIAGQSTVLDIVQMTDEKLKALLDAATKHLKDLNDNKTNSLSAITTAKTGSLAEINTLKTESLKALKTSSDSHISLLDTRKDEHIAAEPGSLPFLFGVLSRYNDTKWGSETNAHGWFKQELGIWYNNVKNTDYMLQLLAGSNTYNYQYSSFYQPPQLHFLQGNNGKFIYRRSFVRRAWSDINNYPYALLGVIFVKNTTNADITRKFNFWVSSYWSSGYEGAGLFAGTPDNTNANKLSISAINWQNLWSSSASDVSQDSSIDVTTPSGKTIVILLYGSAYLNDNYDGYHTYLMRWSIKNFRSDFLTTGLEVDVERTLRAWQCPGLDATYKIWN